MKSARGTAAPIHYRGFDRRNFYGAFSGPCTSATVRCSSASDMRTDSNKCCLDHIRRMLKFIGEGLTSRGVTWWADYGTLLGAARHQDVIPWDKDGDIGVLFDDWGEVSKLVKGEWSRVYKILPREHRDSIKVRVSEINKTNVDIFFWRRKGGDLYRTRYAGVDKFKGKEFPEEWLLPMEDLPFHDFSLPAPREWEKLLVHRYGDWKKPIAKNNDGKVR